MGQSNIKRIIAAALLLAFTAPVTTAISESSYFSSSSMQTAMPLSGGVNLVNSSDKITLSLRDSDVKQVLRMFADKAGLNIVFHESVGGKVTLDLVDTSVNEAFNLVLTVAGLNYYRQGNTMIVICKNHADNAIYSKQEMMMFPIKYVSAAKIANFLNQNVFSMKKPGMSGIDAATVNAATNELIVFGMPSDEAIVKKVIEQFDKEPYTKTFAVNHTTPAEMADMICNLLIPSRGYGSGGANGPAAGGSAPKATPAGGPTGGAAGVMTGGAASSGGGNSGRGASSGSSELKLGEGIVACSVAPAGVGSVSPFDMQNLAVAYYPQRGTVSVMGGSEAQAAMIEKFIRDNDVKQPQAMLELSIIELNEEGSKMFQNQWGVYSKHWIAKFDGEGFDGGHPSPGNLFSNFYPETYYVKEYDDKGILTGDKAVNLHSAYPSGIKIAWYMNYIIQNQKGRVLSNPKLLITNGQESTIDLTQDYLESVKSEFLSSTASGEGASGIVQRTYTKGSDLGIKIGLTPFISPEGYVTLNIKPEYSTIANYVTATGETGTQERVMTLLNRRNLDLKNIRIKDGETLVIGGMLQEQESKTVNKIPLLGDLPVIGALFRSTATGKTKNELVIMITPKIISDGEGSVADNI